MIKNTGLTLGMLNVKTATNYEKTVLISGIVLVALQIILFPIIQLTSWQVSMCASYLAIVLVGAFALITVLGEKSAHLIRLGLLFTLVADYFLVIKDDAELEGVIAFLAVQLCYCAYLVIEEKRRNVRNLNIYTRVLLVTVLVILCIVVLGDLVDALSIVSVIYYANLVVNVAFAFLLGREKRIFAIGLVLFAMCDLCIGLDVLFDAYLESDALDIFFGRYFNLPWVFYQPSQTLIALYLGRQIFNAKDGV